MGRHSALAVQGPGGGGEHLGLGEVCLATSYPCASLRLARFWKLAGHWVNVDSKQVESDFDRAFAFDLAAFSHLGQGAIEVAQAVDLDS